jgi:hypothetical protein
MICIVEQIKYRLIPLKLETEQHISIYGVYDDKREAEYIVYYVNRELVTDVLYNLEKDVRVIDNEGIDRQIFILQDILDMYKILKHSNLHPEFTTELQFSWTDARILSRILRKLLYYILQNRKIVFNQKNFKEFFKPSFTKNNRTNIRTYFPTFLKLHVSQSILTGLRETLSQYIPYEVLENIYRYQMDVESFRCYYAIKNK